MGVGKDPVAFNIFEDRFMTVWKRWTFLRRIRWSLQLLVSLWSRKRGFEHAELCRVLRFHCHQGVPHAHGLKLRAWESWILSLGFLETTSFSKVPPPVDREAP